MEAALATLCADAAACNVSRIFYVASLWYLGNPSLFLKPPLVLCHIDLVPFFCVPFCVCVCVFVLLLAA